MKPLQNILKKRMEKNGYLPEQVFNADEMVLFWKRMPTCTSIAKDEQRTRDFKPGKEKLKVLLCSNASGDFLNPCCFTDSEILALLKENARNTFPCT